MQLILCARVSRRTRVLLDRVPVGPQDVLRGAHLRLGAEGARYWSRLNHSGWVPKGSCFEKGWDNAVETSLCVRSCNQRLQLLQCAPWPFHPCKDTAPNPHMQSLYD